MVSGVGYQDIRDRRLYGVVDLNISSIVTSVLVLLIVAVFTFLPLS